MEIPSRTNRKSTIVNISAQPDINDPNNYCHGCKKYYASKNGYRQHLRVIHRMTILTPRPPSAAAAVAAPVAMSESSRYYCRGCKRGFDSKSSYRNHLLIIHKTKFADFV